MTYTFDKFIPEEGVVKVFYQEDRWHIVSTGQHTYAMTEVDAGYKGRERAKEIQPCSLLIFRQDGTLKSNDTYPVPKDMLGRGGSQRGKGASADEWKRTNSSVKKMAEGKAE